MVNMYGAGKAFNLRYQQNNHRLMPRPGFQHAQQKAMILGGCHGHHHSGPTNVTINQGPQGFWGFMSGLFGGLFGGGMMGGLFGPFNQISGGGYMGGMPTIQNTKNQTQAQQLQNLQTLFPDYSIVSEEGGKFSTISKKDGSVISGTYEEMKTKLAADKGAKPDTEKPDTEKPGTEKPGTEKPGTEKPGTEKPGTEKPGTEKPGTEKPGTEKPGTEKPDTEKPDTNPATKGGSTPGTPATADQIKDYKGKFTVSDKVRGDAGNITRNNCIMSSEKVDGFPKQITVGGYTYDYVRTEDGAAIYKSTAASAAGDEYRLEKNADGTFGLNQYKGMKGAGTADITQASKAATVKSPGHDNLTGEKPWTAEQKAEYNKPVEVQFAVSTKWVNTGGTATVKMPDGTVFTAETGLGTDKGNFNALAQDLLGQIHAAGWTGVTTLQNTNPAMQEVFDGTNSWSKTYDPNAGAVSNNPTTQGADAGETVAENLGGYTTDNEKQEAIQLIQAQTPQSIKSFLNGYKEESEIGKEDIMTQIAHESEWSDIERKSSYQKIIANVLVASKDKIGTDAYKGLQDLQNNLLQNKIQTLSEDQAIAADKWINELMQ